MSGVDTTEDAIDRIIVIEADERTDRRLLRTAAVLDDETGALTSAGRDRASRVLVHCDSLLSEHRVGALVAPAADGSGDVRLVPDLTREAVEDAQLVLAAQEPGGPGGDGRARRSLGVPGRPGRRRRS